MIRRLSSAPATAISMAAPIVAFGVLAWSRRWMADDGYIYLRVVRQLLDGNGPVYNHGERVEAASSPLWVGLLALTKEVLRPVDLPWLAVVLGLALSVAGLALAQWGAYRLSSRGRGVLVPFGALVIVALPPFWDFATSGLETGLAFAWLGACWWGLAGEVRGRSSKLEARSSIWLPVLLGLGPLLRPDFVLYSIAFLAALLLMRPMSSRARTRAVALAIALPLAYEVFRAGYYAALVPNPAFAKEASSPRVTQGWYYLLDALQTYWLFVPALFITVAIALWLATRPWRTQRAATVLIAATIVAALAHGAYVIYVGGDFMHARMLLPAIFALAMPFAVIEIADWRALAPALGVIVWAVVCGALLRPAYDGIGPHGIANERAYYVARAHNAHPITIGDYRQYHGAALAEIDAAKAPPGSLILANNAAIPLRPKTSSRIVIEGTAIGIFGYVLNDDVYVLDLHGLADPIASRLALKVRGRPGHEKVLPEPWAVARFADPNAAIPQGGPSAGAVETARTALGCGDIRRLLADVSDPMRPGRFARNLVDAFRLNRLRIPPPPSEAQRRFC